MTGELLTRKELIKLNFHKNAEGKYHCPVTFKVNPFPCKKRLCEFTHRSNAICVCIY